MEPFQELVRESVEKEHALVGMWMERMLQSGQHGVKIVRKNGFIVEIGLHAEVPYGQIHEHQTRD